MDLSTLDTTEVADKGAPMELRGPNGAPVLKDDKTPVTITLVGADSDIARKARNAALNRHLKQGRKAQVTAEGSEADAIAYLAKCTVGWDGIVVDGAPLPCDDANARKLYERFPWIKEQVDEFIADRANFLKASPKT